MEKTVVNMSEWELHVWNEEYRLSGIADRHPLLGKNVYIGHTSRLEQYSFEEDILTYETENTIYKCPLKYMNTEPYLNVDSKYKKKLTKRDEASDSILDKIIAATARLSMGVELDNEFVAHILKVTETGKAELEAMKKAEDERLIAIAKQYEDCIYIEVSNIDAGDKLAYHIGNECGTIESSIHVGMMQDSILYTKYGEKGVLFDFRYFPKWDSMQPYCWSINIKQAVIKNISDCPIRFSEETTAFGEIIEPGETKIFTPKEKPKMFDDSMWD